MTPAEKDKALELNEQGTSYTELARMFDMPYDRLRYQVSVWRRMKEPVTKPRRLLKGRQLNWNLPPHNSCSP